MKNKEYYKIGEISKLYGIGTDSLRYYEEIGILKPKRDFNGYRMYNINDIRVLNILRELRTIGFSLQEIKAHLADYNLEKTLDLFEKEIEYINKKTVELNLIKLQLIDRIEEIKEHMNDEKSMLPVTKNIGERKILQLSAEVYRDDELDFIIKKLQKQNEDQIYIIGNGDIGSSLDRDDLLAGNYGKYTSVFYITENNIYDEIIPGGTYLSMIIKGGYSRLPLAWEEMISYIKKNKLESIGSPIELYIIDNHDTNDENEFVTEIQIRIK